MHHVFLAILTSCAIVHANYAVAESIPTMSVNVSHYAGEFVYEYTAVVPPESEASVFVIYLSVGPDAALHDVTAPAGWFTDYVNGDSSVAWTSTDPVFDIQPGQNASFSFYSHLPAQSSQYIFLGVLLDGSDVVALSDHIQAPITVPEPGTWAMFLMGAAIMGMARGLTTKSRIELHHGR